MHSTEIVAVFLVAIGIIAGRSLLGVLALVWRGIFSALLREKQPPERILTPFGEFVKDHGVDYWQGSAVSEATEIVVVAGDVKGNPNPVLLERLPGILAELTALERIARAEVDTLTDKHILDQITDDESAEFVLGFSYDEEWWGETVYVYFKDGEVVHWDSAD